MMKIELMEFTNMKSKKLFSLVIISIIIYSLSLLAGCIGNSEVGDFNFLEWKTIGTNNSKTDIIFNFYTNISEGYFYLYNPNGFLIEKKLFNNNMNNISFTISNSKSEKPELGPYKVEINLIESNNEKNIMKLDDIILKDANLSITECKPFWRFDEINKHYSLESINISIKNFGDVYGFIYEGRVIVDNNSIFLAPDYHWHDLNLWLKPNQRIFIELPVKVPWLEKGTHFIKVYMQDKLIETVALYENTIITP